MNSLAKNSVYNIFYKLLNIVFPLLTSAYVARILLPDGVGKVAYALNIVQYFLLVAALGLPNYGTREIARVRDDRNKLNSLFSELFIINAISTTICILAYYSLISYLPVAKANKTLYNLIGLCILLNYINVDCFFQGTEEYKYITIRSTVIKVLSLIAVFLFVNDVNDYIFYAGISCVAIAGNNILNIIGLIKKKIKISFKRLNITSHLKPVLILLCTTLSIELYTLFDTTMIGVLCDDAAVGYYTNSMRIVKTVIALIAAVGGVLLPRLSMYYSNGEIDKCKETVNKVLNLMLFFIIPAGVGIGFCASEIIILMYGKAFSPAILTLQIGSLLVYVLGLSNLFGTQILLTFKDEKKLLIATIIGAVSNLVMNYFFIKLFAQNGAVVASIISELLVTLITLFYASKHIKISISKKGLLSSVISTIIMIIFILILKIIIKNLYVLLALEVIIGFSVYFVMALITKNPALYEAINAMKQIIKPDRNNSV